MQDQLKTAGSSAALKRGRAPKQKVKFATRVFNLILKYKDSGFFVWVNRHWVLSMVVVAMWGMVIVGMFLWFVVSSITQTPPAQ